MIAKGRNHVLTDKAQRDLINLHEKFTKDMTPQDRLSKTSDEAEDMFKRMQAKIQSFTATPDIEAWEVKPMVIQGLAKLPEDWEQSILSKISTAKHDLAMQAADEYEKQQRQESEVA